MMPTDDRSANHLQALHSDFADLSHLALDCAAKAEQEAIFDASFEFRTRNHRGLRAHAQLHHHLGLVLRDLGFERDEKGWQMRHRHPLGYRVLIGRGKYLGQGRFEVGEKGELTRTLIDRNADALGMRPSLFSRVDCDGIGKPCVNYWLFIQPHGYDAITAYLSVPVCLNYRGTVIGSSEWECIGVRDLSATAINLTEVSEPSAVNFEVKIRDAE